MIIWDPFCEPFGDRLDTVLETFWGPFGGLLGTVWGTIWGPFGATLDFWSKIDQNREKSAIQNGQNKHFSL